MTTTGDAPGMHDMQLIVAKHLSKLQEPCSDCREDEGLYTAHHSEISDTTLCDTCRSTGWVATLNLQKIIMNIEYNFTLVLQHDIIGWMADITLDGVPKSWLDNERPVYSGPVDAIYAGLYRVLANALRSPENTPKHHTKYLSTITRSQPMIDELPTLLPKVGKPLNTNLDASR